MINRARQRSGQALRQVGVILASERDELQVFVGLALLSGGIWMYAPGVALIVAGAVLLWIALPQRQPFVRRPPTVIKRSRRSPLEE